MQLVQKNGLEILIKNSKKTPRTSVNVFFKIDKVEKYSGLYGIYTKLLLCGTKNRNSKILLEELENNAIDMSIKAKQDYLKIGLVFLNEDFDLALDILKDVILNSTFEELEKEIFKTKNEIISELDIPRIIATDNFIKNLFEGHYYSHSYSSTLNDIEKIKKEDIIEIHNQMLESKKVISIAGDFKDTDKIIDFFTANFDFLKSVGTKSEIQEFKALNFEEDNKIVKVAKNDINQAQILQGYIVPNFNYDDYTSIAIMNNILGSSGLSSRLFVELRDKQGLAYTVRSSYENLDKSAIFSFYIATEPKNIQKSLDGFKLELEKLASVPPTKDEMQGAIENITGKLEYFYQTNSQIASTQGFNYLMGLGLNYNKKYLEMLSKVKPEDVSRVAKMILSQKSLITVVAPKDSLDF